MEGSKNRYYIKISKGSAREKMEDGPPQNFSPIIKYI